MINLIDVGYTGDLGPAWDKHKDIIGNVMSFNPVAQAVCNGTHLHLNFAISSTEGERDFNVYRKLACSSLLEADLDVCAERSGSPSDLDLAEKKKVVCVRLDSMLEFVNMHFDFLKIDTQGSDMDVVNSLGKYINFIYGIQMEVFYKPMYKGTPLFDEIKDEMAQRNFQLYTTLRKPNPLFTDALFINNNAPKRIIDIIKEVYS